MADARVVAILTRAPSSGGKTRLFATLGREADPALLEALLLDTIDGVRGAGVAAVVAVDPPQAVPEIGRIVPQDVAVIGQAQGPLGERMREVMGRLLEQGARAVVLVGSDLPDIEASAVGEAFALLDEDPDGLVLGPATDGGYYLIAATRVPDVFDGVTWGGGAVLAETVAAASRAGMRVRLIGPMSDIDTASDLERLMSRPTAGASRTIEWARASAAGSRGRPLIG